MIVPGVSGFISSNTFTPCDQIGGQSYGAAMKQRNIISGWDLERKLAEEIHRHRLKFSRILHT
jgi:hypothetical protein